MGQLPNASGVLSSQILRLILVIVNDTSGRIRISVQIFSLPSGETLLANDIDDDPC